MGVKENKVFFFNIPATNAKDSPKKVIWTSLLISQPLRDFRVSTLYNYLPFVTMMITIMGAIL